MEITRSQYESFRLQRKQFNDLLELKEKSILRFVSCTHMKGLEKNMYCHRSYLVVKLERVYDVANDLVKKIIMYISDEESFEKKLVFTRKNKGFYIDGMNGSGSLRMFTY